MEPIILVALPMLVVVLIGTIQWWYSEPQRFRRALAAVPPVPVGSLKNGEVVRIRGVLRPVEDASLTSPLGRRPCTAYRVDVRVGQGLFSRRRMSCEAQSFLVEDATGAARVAPAQYTLDLRTSFYANASVMRDLPADAESWLQSKGVRTTDMLGVTRTIVCREGVLTEGHAVTVFGRVEFEYIDDPSSAEGYRDRPRRAVIVSPQGSMLKISNDPSLAGVVSGLRATLRALLAHR